MKTPKPFLKRGEGVAKRIFGSQIRRTREADKGSDPYNVQEDGQQSDKDDNAWGSVPQLPVQSNRGSNDLQFLTDQDCRVEKLGGNAGFELQAQLLSSNATAKSGYRAAQPGNTARQLQDEDLELAEFEALEQQIKKDLLGSSDGPATKHYAQPASRANNFHDQVSLSARPGSSRLHSRTGLPASKLQDSGRSEQIASEPSQTFSNVSGGYAWDDDQWVEEDEQGTVARDDSSFNNHSDQYQRPSEHASGRPMQGRANDDGCVQLADPVVPETSSSSFTYSGHPGQQRQQQQHNVRCVPGLPGYVATAVHGQAAQENRHVQSRLGAARPMTVGQQHARASPQNSMYSDGADDMYEDEAHLYENEAHSPYNQHGHPAYHPPNVHVQQQAATLTQPFVKSLFNGGQANSQGQPRGRVPTPTNSTGSRRSTGRRSNTPPNARGGDEAESALHHVASGRAPGHAIGSLWDKAAQDRISALEQENARLLQERSALLRLRTELEKATLKLEADKQATEKKQAADAAALEAWKAAETAKLDRERRVLDKQGKALLKLPTKKERSAVEAVEAILEEERKEARAAAARHKLNLDRLRRQLADEQEKSKELREEIRWHEAQRLGLGLPESKARSMTAGNKVANEGRAGAVSVGRSRGGAATPQLDRPAVQTRVVAVQAELGDSSLQALRLQEMTDALLPHIKEAAQVNNKGFDHETRRDSHNPRNTYGLQTNCDDDSHDPYGYATNHGEKVKSQTQPGSKAADVESSTDRMDRYIPNKMSVVSNKPPRHTPLINMLSTRGSFGTRGSSSSHDIDREEDVPQQTQQASQHVGRSQLAGQLPTRGSLMSSRDDPECVSARASLDEWGSAPASERLTSQPSNTSLHSDPSTTAYHLPRAAHAELPIHNKGGLEDGSYNHVSLPKHVSSHPIPDPKASYDIQALNELGHALRNLRGERSQQSPGMWATQQPNYTLPSQESQCSTLDGTTATAPLAQGKHSYDFSANQSQASTRRHSHDLQNHQTQPCSRDNQPLTSAHSASALQSYDACTSKPAKADYQNASAAREHAPDLLANSAASASRQNDYIVRELKHTDGKTEVFYSSGRRDVHFGNGTLKVVMPKGGTTIVRFSNGDIKNQQPDGTTEYYYAEVSTWHATYKNGIEVFHFVNGQTEAHFAGGHKEVLFPDGSARRVWPDGREEDVHRSSLSPVALQPCPRNMLIDLGLA